MASYEYTYGGGGGFVFPGNVESGLALGDGSAGDGGNEGVDGTAGSAQTTGTRSTASGGGGGFGADGGAAGTSGTSVATRPAGLAGKAIEDNGHTVTLTGTLSTSPGSHIYGATT